LVLAAGVALPASLSLMGASQASAAVTTAGSRSAPALHTAYTRPGGAVSPDSASGCGGYQVCIDVNGSGLNVKSVTGTVESLSGSWCGYETLRGTIGSATYIYVASPTECLPVFATYKYTWNLNEDFPNGTKMCLGQVTKSGTNPGGPACETIEG
jgi:hypothetical protein